MTPLGCGCLWLFRSCFLLQVAVAICWFIQSMTSRSFQTSVSHSSENPIGFALFQLQVPIQRIDVVRSGGHLETFRHLKNLRQADEVPWGVYSVLGIRNSPHRNPFGHIRLSISLNAVRLFRSDGAQVRSGSSHCKCNAVISNPVV